MEIIQDPRETKARKQHMCDFCQETIAINEKYIKAVYKEDNIYSWKSHLYCQNIASKLRMFNQSNESGVTSDDFQEYINEEYRDIITKTETELYESTTYTVPEFKDRLEYVLKYHNIKTN